MEQPKKADLLEDYEQLAPAHRRALAETAHGDRPLLLLQAPPYRNPEVLTQLFALYEDRLVHLTDRGSSMEIETRMLDRMTAFLVELHLEDSSLVLRGRVNGRGHYQTKVAFDFRDHQVFRQFLIRLRSQVNRFSPSPCPGRSLAYLRELNLRFYDVFTDLMLKDDQIVESIYQPENPQISMPAQLLVLTTSEVILIRAPEDPEEAVGGSFLFYPLEHITGGRLDSAYGQMTFDLNLLLDRGEILPIRFAKEALSAFKDFDRTLGRLCDARRSAGA